MQVDAAGLSGRRPGRRWQVPRSAVDQVDVLRVRHDKQVVVSLEARLRDGSRRRMCVIDDADVTGVPLEPTVQHQLEITAGADLSRWFWWLVAAFEAGGRPDPALRGRPGRLHGVLAGLNAYAGPMARITIEIDDELLGEAAHVLGTSGGEATVLAALRAAARGATPQPRHPGSAPLGDPPPLRPLGDPSTPEVPGPTRFPHPPEIH